MSTRNRNRLAEMLSKAYDGLDTDDVRPEKIANGEDRPETIVHPARLWELVEGVAYNSDLPEERTIGVEAAVAHLVLDR